MSDGGEPKQDSKHRLRSPMSGGGELNRIAHIG